MLPVGVQTFRKVRESGSFYVDKTAFAAKMIAEGTHYFLSRPRRFGKSVFVDTLKELFEGDEELFEGLDIYDQWDWSVSRPVVRLDFSSGDGYADPDGLRVELVEQLGMIEAAVGVESGAGNGAGSLSGRLRRLLEELHRMSGRRVVVLVDEYDKPILDALSVPQVAVANRDLLRGVYSSVKFADAHIRFVFLTGVSKFSKVSLFSGLNNLDDITLNPAYSSICGFTETELDAVFAEELEGLDRRAVREWYNGYNWLGDEKVYNPYDVLLLLKNREFGNYWFETGSPRFLIDVLTERGVPSVELDRAVADMELLSAFDVDHIATEALLFQAGYLTIVKGERYDGEMLYELGYPNREVRQSLNRSLLRWMLGDTAYKPINALRLRNLLGNGDTRGMRALLEKVYAGIPYQWHTRNEIARFEGYYASVFYSCFAATGLDVIVEDSTSSGRVDMTVKTPERVWLFEFKIAETSKPGEGMRQLRERGYADKYRDHGTEVILAAVDFSRETRNITTIQTTTA